jgi:hypothetical protein
MWGAVVGLGMRWKAFASADMLNDRDDTKEITMDWYEAQLSLRYSVQFGIPPEWFHISKWDFATEFEMKLKELMKGGYDPWGLNKGKGGGLTMHASDLNFRNTKEANEFTVESDSKTTASWLFAGRRILVQGLELNPELNGTKGTLVEEVEKGVWHVIVDGSGDKLLKEKNIAQIHTVAPVEAKEVKHQYEAHVCLAGNWDDWKLHDMQWDEESHCCVLDVKLPYVPNATFAIQRGQAATLKWKPRMSPKKWSMGPVTGAYRIKVCVKDSKIGLVEWERNAA